MKLLFDQNLSPALPGHLRLEYPGSCHVRDCGMKDATDSEIWEYAAKHEYLITSKDADFHQRALLSGPPPKVIWIGLGNCLTADVVRLLRSQRLTVEAFARDTAASLLVLR